MKEIRNLTLTVVTGDGQWGQCYNESSCSGMIGMVNRKEVDFAIGMYKILQGFQRIVNPRCIRHKLL